MLEASGAIVIAAPSVQRGLSLLENQNIDAAILDLQFDGDTVFPMAERLLSLNIPFVFATAYVDPELPGTYGGFHLCARETELRHIGEALFGIGAST
ncbi:response regulator [Rhizobium grahamii]|uniref:Response regulator receiver protein n=1 Tax=Rhizobium grahamii CCGE 502 TaxID=990285 RepID=S3HDV7_9HYPH|nr:response regulator [Rhizobium grahamii]EPE96914.1 response regulator receiver protein [Rhizobium grahamii CCGE 502]